MNVAVKQDKAVSAKTVFKHLPCAACAADDCREIGPAMPFLQTAGIDEGVENISVVRCNRCGFYYADPMPFFSEESNNDLYGREYFNEEMTQWWSREKTCLMPERRLDMIERYTGKGKPGFLDIGCGKGYAMAKAAARGWDVYGQDITDTFADEIEKISGVNLFVGDVRDALFEDEYFDVVYLDSVIEHLPGPFALLKEIHRITRKGGVVYIVTPNADALIHRFRNMLRRILNKKEGLCISPTRPPFHINGFTRRSFEIICSKAGFAIERLQVRSGRNEWRKFKKKSWRLRLRHLIYRPVFLVGEIIGRGITIEALISRVEAEGTPER
jgi:SAM-dependent methyltransferase